MAVKTVTSERMMLDPEKSWEWLAAKLTDVLLVRLEHLHESLTDFTFRNLDVVLGITVISHEGQEAIIGDVQLRKTTTS